MQRREDWMFFYERIDWMGVANFLSAYFGNGGIIIAGFLRFISIWILSPIIFSLIYLVPIVVLILIITKLRRGRHARKMQKLLSYLQRKCRLIKTASKHSFKH